MSINAHNIRQVEELKMKENNGNFSLNAKNQNLLFAIIMGNIVLPKKNPILVEEM